MSATLPPVLFVTGEYPPRQGGLADYTRLLREALGERGVRSGVITRRGPPGPGDERDVGRVVERWSLRSLGQVADAAARGSLVHVQYQPAAFDLRGEICLLPLALRLRRADLRVATTFHDARVPYLFPKAGALRRAAVRLLAAASHAVLAADADDLRALGGPSPRYHQVPIGTNVADAPPDGYDRDRFRREQLGVQPGDLVVAYFGFLNSSKGLDPLLDAFDRVRRARPDARLLVLGGEAGASDPTDRLTAARIEGRLAAPGSAVIRPGYLAAPDLSAHLRAADVALLPYVDGASPRRGSLLACASHHLPIVTTEGPGVSLLIREAVALAPRGDASALAETLLALMADSARLEALRSGAARLASETSWERIADRHLAIYRAILRRPVEA